MSNDASNVVVGTPKATGGVYSGSTSATLPTSPTSALNGSLSALGYVSEDGLVMSTGRDSTTLRDWGGEPVRIIQNNDEVTFAWAFLETSLAVLKEYFGQDNASAVSIVNTVEVNGDPMPERAFVFEMLDGDTAYRVVVPKAVVTARTDLTFVSTDAVSYGVTVTCLPDASGNKAYIYHTKFAS